MPLNCQPATKARTTPVVFFAIALPGPNGSSQMWLIVNHFAGPLKFGYIPRLNGFWYESTIVFCQVNDVSNWYPMEKRFSMRACNELNRELPSFARILMLWLNPYSAP